MARAWPVLTVGLACAAACPQQRQAAPAPDTPAAARDEILIQLNERASKIVDFHVKGRRCQARCDQDDATLQQFEAQVRTPGMFRLEVPALGVTTTFDGKRLTSTDAKAKAAQEIDLTAQGAQGAGALPYQVISEFLVEGWRPPLLGLAPDKIGSRRERLPGATAEVVVLERPLEDADLARVEYWLRLPKADFVEKRFVRKDGGVTKRVVVDREHVDARTGYAFPARWHVVDASGATDSFVELTEIAVNAGVPMNAFVQEIPEGYQRVATPAAQ